MKIKRGNNRGRANPVLVGTLGILLACAASFGLATLWHNRQQPVAGAQSPGGQIARPEDALNITLEQQGNDAVGQDGTDTPTVDRPQYEGAVPETSKVSNSYFDDAIFFGDSISTGIPLYHIADNAAVVAMSGANPYNIMDKPMIRLEDGREVTMLEAAEQYGTRAKVYIMLGGNGLWLSEKNFVEGYQDFIDAVRAMYPDAVIYLQSITPVSPDVGERYEGMTNEKVIEYNLLVQELARKNNLYFVNVFEALAGPDGYLPDAASTDGLHLTPEYYALWFEYLKTHTVEAG